MSNSTQDDNTSKQSETRSENSRFETTAEIKISQDPFKRIIGQDEVVKIARLIPHQRRHLMLVGPPGTGKSMIAQAIASVLLPPKQEIAVLDNLRNPERPIVKVTNSTNLESEKAEYKNIGVFLTPLDVPSFVAERLGYRCNRCGAFSAYTMAICPTCSAQKFYNQKKPGMMEENLFGLFGYSETPKVVTYRRLHDGNEEQIIYERSENGRIRMLKEEDLRKINEQTNASRKKIIVPLDRPTFVQVNGASETELLGDVKHDPYGGHPQLGTPSYARVVAGAIHEAHEGVLFLDELSTMGALQKNILTAMQEKEFSIVGRNPTSSGAIVRVDNVPCAFILVGSININDLPLIIPPLRSRIRGEGYEVLMESHMPDTDENRKKLASFVANEIARDGKIPHASFSAVQRITEEAKRICKKIDNKNGLTLRLRIVSGFIKLAGDMAVAEKSTLIEKNHIEEAIKNSKTIEEQLHEKYGSWWKAESADYGFQTPKAGAETS